MGDFLYASRNGETTIPEVSPTSFEYYWFDGKASYEEWRQMGNRTVMVTGVHTDRVVGLVVVMMGIDIKKTIMDQKIERTKPLMIAEIETMGYDLETCEGVWYGPVHMPLKSDADDLFPSMAAIIDYEEWLKFYTESS